MKMTAETKKMVEDQLNIWFEIYVPECGMAKTLGGELVRAMERMLYRFYNDGDKVGYLYGNETCNGSYRFVSTFINIPTLDGEIQGDEEYEDRLYEAARMTVEYISNNPVFEIENIRDSRETSSDDYARESEQEREAYPEEYPDEEEGWEEDY